MCVSSKRCSVVLCFCGGTLTDSETDVQILDEEEYLIIRDIKEQKKIYQEYFQDYRTIHSEVVFLRQMVHSAKVNLCDAFLEWYACTFFCGSYLLWILGRNLRFLFFPEVWLSGTFLCDAHLNI